MSLVLNMVVDLPSCAMRNTVAGEPVPTYAFPEESLASAQTYVEGMLDVSVLAGAAANEPSLAIARPCGRPFSHSSICDSVQTLVPCARQEREMEQSKKERLTVRRDMWLKSKAGRSIREHGAVSHRTFADLGHGLIDSAHWKAFGLSLHVVASGHFQHLCQRQRTSGVAAANASS